MDEVSSDLEIIVLDRVRVNEQFSDLNERIVRAKKALAYEYVYKLETVKTEINLFIKSCEIK